MFSNEDACKVIAGVLHKEELKRHEMISVVIKINESHAVMVTCKVTKEAYKFVIKNHKKP
jgi:hypothetical protein